LKRLKTLMALAAKMTTKIALAVIMAMAMTVIMAMAMTVIMTMAMMTGMEEVPSHLLEGEERSRLPVR
jgi:hypothetical protein